MALVASKDPPLSYTILGRVRNRRKEGFLRRRIFFFAIQRNNKGEVAQRRYRYLLCPYMQNAKKEEEPGGIANFPFMGLQETPMGPVIAPLRFPPTIS